MKPYNLTIHVIQSPEEMSVFEAYAFEECEESKEYLEERMKEEQIQPKYEIPDARFSETQHRSYLRLER